MNITVLVVDDHYSVRKWVKLTLEDEEGLEVAGEASDGDEAIRLAEELSPDAIVMDVRMPGGGGIQATQTIKAKGNGAAVVALSLYNDSETVAAMLSAGALGYVTKERMAEDLAPAIHAAVAGESFLSPGAHCL